MAELRISNKQWDTLVNRICVHGWIPVKKQMPRDFKEVLIYRRSGNIEIAYHSSNLSLWYLSVNPNIWLTDDTKHFWSVIAWQPLPEPYEEDE